MDGSEGIFVCGCGVLYVNSYGMYIYLVKFGSSCVCVSLIVSKSVNVEFFVGRNFWGGLGLV